MNSIISSKDERSLLPPNGSKSHEACNNPRVKSKGLWLSGYFLCSLCLTIYNKAILQLLHFPLPCMLTGIHTFIGWMGFYLLAYFGVFTPMSLTKEQKRTIMFFSVMYTLNIVVSNMSLKLVTVPVHQVARAIVPAITMLLSKIFFNESYSTLSYLSLVPVIIGVPMATFGDYYFSMLGFIVTLIGAGLASVKTIFTNKVQVGNHKLPPLDLLYYMSPVAFAQSIVWAFIFGEHNEIFSLLQKGQFTQDVTATTFVVALIGNGLLAFLLNYVSFTANGVTSPLMMCVAGNMKQVLSIVVSIFIFSLKTTPLNALGISLTLLGGALYTSVELKRKNSIQVANFLSLKNKLINLQAGLKWKKLILIVAGISLLLYLSAVHVEYRELTLKAKETFPDDLAKAAPIVEIKPSLDISNITPAKQTSSKLPKGIATPPVSILIPERVCVPDPFYNAPCPAEVKIYGNNKKVIPKKIWTFWGGPGNNQSDIEAELPDLVLKCINGWKAYNPDHVVTIVGSLMVKTYIRKTRLPTNFTSFPAKIQANWFRLAVLKEHGGIWLDASVILTQSLSFAHQYQQDHSSEGFMYYLDYFTWNRDYPIYETWFIASVRHSKFITEWLKEYTVILERNLLGNPYLEELVKEYGENTYTEWIQNIQGPDYLNLHVSLQKILRLKKAPRFYSIAAECGPYYIKNCMGWWDNIAIGKALLNGWGGPVPRVIKLIGYERDKIIEMIETGYNVSPASIYSRFLVSNEVQLGNKSTFAKK